MKSNNTIIEKSLENHFSKIFEKELLDEIIEIGSYKTFAKNDVFINIDDKLTHIPLVIDGVIKIVREEKDNDEIFLYYLEKGDTCSISFSNCINQNNSIFRGIVEKDSTCIMIPVNKVEDWLIKYKTWREFIIDSYHYRLIEMVNTINSLAFMNLDSRLNNYLLSKVKIMKNKILATTHQQIANDLNTSRVVVSRLLKKMENSGRIKMGRNKIRVVNL